MAQNGTVKLVKDTQVKYLTINGGTTLDLNGYKLTADYFTSYGTVVDGTDGGSGLLVVNKGVHMPVDNPFLPIYDTAAGGYRVYKYQLVNLGFKTVEGNADSLKAGFRLVLSNADGYNVLANTTDIAVDTFAYLKWTGAAGLFTYQFSDSTLRTYATQAAADVAAGGATNKAIILTLTGVTGLGENATISFSPALVTAPGVAANADTVNWNKQ